LALADDPPRKGPDLLPLLVLGGLALLFVVGYFLFPAFLHAIQGNDCVASGRTDCLPR
jgi:hypothetical protein